jgi:hypothetical protein
VHGERVWFGGGSSVGMELLQGEWRRLNTESPDDAEQRAALWVRGEMVWELSVVVTSMAAHCDCRMTRVRRACIRTVQSDVPDDDTEQMRVELEGVGSDSRTSSSRRTDFKGQRLILVRIWLGSLIDP